MFFIIATSQLGYRVVKTLNYLNEAHDIDAPNTTSQSTSGTSLKPSPQKRKARGMFTDNDMSTEVIVLQHHTQQQQVLLLFMTFGSLNLRPNNMINPLLLLQSVIMLQMTIKVPRFSNLK